jgi:hypothetical protein
MGCIRGYLSWCWLGLGKIPDLMKGQESAGKSKVDILWCLRLGCVILDSSLTVVSDPSRVKGDNGVSNSVRYHQPW